MIQKTFDDIIQGWSQGHYTTQQLITHLMKHAEETDATLAHHRRLLETMEKRLSELEEDMEGRK